MTAALHVVCGLIGSGKSTLAARLVAEAGAVTLAEDALTAALWPGELRTLADYADRSGRLRGALGPHVSAILARGVPVVLDFAANTRGQRAGLLAMAGDAPAVLHWLDVPAETCRARLHARNTAGTHQYAVDDATFDRVAAVFEPPAQEEGFEIRRHV